MADVIVIGAGMAGLRCATDLVAGGADVVVLEARDRVGGRVWSHTFANGQTCERGAEFIDAHHTEVLNLAADLDLRLTRRDTAEGGRATLVDSANRAVPTHLHSSLAGDLAVWEAALAGLRPTVEFESSTVADLVDSLTLSPVARLVIGRELRTEFMLPPDEVSQRFAALVGSNRSARGREIHRVVGGNDQLATGLAKRLGDRVRLGSTVAQIDADSGLVTLATGEELGAGAVVAAVPLPVLSRLWPRMPLGLGALAYGVGGKISVQFAGRPWRDQGLDGTVLSDRSWGHVWETTDDQNGDAGVLTNLLASHDGAGFVALPDSPAQLVKELDRVFPGAGRLAGERVRTDWTNDPHTLGCYVCAGPGQWESALPELQNAHGRLWLAGEHADDLTGFVEGALRSGARVAAAITR